MLNTMTVRHCRRAAPTFAFGVLLMLGMTLPALSAPLFFDPIQYTAGQNLKDQTHVPSGGVWKKPANPNAENLFINEKDVNYPGLAWSPTSNSIFVDRPLDTGGTTNYRVPVPTNPAPNRASGQTLFFSFTMVMSKWFEVTDALAGDTNHRKGGILAGFHGGPANDTTSMTASNGFAAPIYVRRELDDFGVQTGKYELGVTKQAQPLSPPLAQANAAYDMSVSFAPFERVFVVGQYDLVDTTVNQNPGNDIARLWINPTPGDVAAFATPSKTAPGVPQNLGGSLGLLSFHVRSEWLLPGDFLIDNIRIGHTFADVIPAAPEPSSFLLLLLGTIGAGSLTRRRAA